MARITLTREQFALLRKQHYGQHLSVVVLAAGWGMSIAHIKQVLRGRNLRFRREATKAAATG